MWLTYFYVTSIILPLTAHIIEKYNAAIAIHLNIWQSIVFFWEGGGFYCRL